MTEITELSPCDFSEHVKQSKLTPGSLVECYIRLMPCHVAFELIMENQKSVVNMLGMIQ